MRKHLSPNPEVHGTLRDNVARSTAIELNALSAALPLCAEEGPYREVVAQSELVAILAGTCSHEKAQGALSILRRMFEVFGLLDTAELASSSLHGD